MGKMSEMEKNSIRQIRLFAFQVPDDGGFWI